MSKKDDLSNTIFRIMSETFLEYVDYDASLTESEIKDNFIKFVDKATRNGFYISTDYTENLLKKARSFFDEKELYLSSLFYATYFEHQINYLISGVCNRKKISTKDVIQILREIPFRAKCSWLLKILDLNPVAPEHLKIMAQVFEVRNSFVHYKWQCYNMDSHDSEKEESKIFKILNEAEKSVRYLKRRINKNIHQDKKRAVKLLFKTPESN